jgi:hypothetical protein
VDSLLFGMQCFSEDQIFFQDQIEFEIVEKIIMDEELKIQHKEHLLKNTQNRERSLSDGSQEEGERKNSRHSLSIKQAVKLSMFTIHEDEDGEEEGEEEIEFSAQKLRTESST